MGASGMHISPNLQIVKRGGDPRLVFLSGSGRITGILKLYGKTVTDIKNILYDRGVLPKQQDSLFGSSAADEGAARNLQNRMAAT
eukprot:1552843-Pyramimonas_sp.AAC.1